MQLLAIYHFVFVKLQMTHGGSTVHVIVCDRSNRLTENCCESKRAGFFYCRCAIFFNVYHAWKCLWKKNAITTWRTFYSKSISVDLWLVYRLNSACQWLVTNKQTNTKPIQIHDLSMFYLLWFWRSQSLRLVFSSKFLPYLSRKQMSLALEQLYFNDQRYHNYRTFSYNRNELS